MERKVTFTERKEIFEFGTVAKIDDNGSFKRFLDWPLVAHHFDKMSYSSTVSDEHQALSNQIIENLQRGESLPDGVIESSSLESQAPPRSRENPVLITNWHIKSDMQIYQGIDLHSSPIEAVEGNVVKTVSGHYYILVGRDPNIRVVQQLLASPGSPHDTYCTADPLNPVSLSQLLLAEKIVYGDARVPCAQLVSSLLRVEAALGRHEQLETVKDILRSFGITPDSVISEQVACAPPVQLPAGQIGIKYGLLLGPNDTSLGHHIAVLSRVSLRELVLRIMYEHRQRHIFSLCLMKVEPLTADMCVEWITGDNSSGGWVPEETCESVVMGNTPLRDLGFGLETDFVIKMSV